MIWYDVTLKLPLGLALTDTQRENHVVVEQVRAGGSVAEHNSRYMFTDGSLTVPHFVQAGDELLMVNGARCTSVETAVELITEASEQQEDEVVLKLARPSPGMVTVVFPEDGTSTTATGSAEVSAAAEAANHRVVYKCTDGTCGSCWRKDYTSDEVYFLCIDGTKVGQRPSQSVFKEESLFWSDREWRNNRDRQPNVDNTEPLVLEPCPEVYAQWREANPIKAFASDATVSRFGGALSGLVGGDTVNPPESKSSKWGGGRSWEGGDAD